MFFLIFIAALPFKLHFLKPLATVDLAILLFAGHAALTRKIEWRSFFWGAEAKFLALFCILLLFSAKTFSYKGLQPLCTLPLFYFIRAGAMIDRDLIKKGLYVLLAVSLFEAAVACGQYFFQHPLGLKILGEVKFTSRHYQACVFYTGEGSSVYRAYGTFLHPNILGGFLTFSIFGSYLLFLRSKKKVLITGALALQMTALFLTFSRAALLGLIIGSIFWFVLMRKEKGVRILALWMASLLAFSLILFYSQLEARGGFVSYNTAAYGSDQGRLAYQENALSLLADHPLLGVGYGAYLDYFHIYVHNIFLLIGAEMGMAGLVLFLAFIFAVAARSWKFKNDIFAAAALSALCALMVLGLCDFYLWVHVPGRAMLIFVVGIASRIVVISSANAVSARRAQVIGA